MKKIYILFALLIGMGSLLAQRPKTEYETDSKWFIGLNAGGIWHTSDVKNKTQLGWGFMVGRSFNYNYGTPVSFDLRMRYLRGFWVGQDKDISLVSATDNGLNGTMDPAVNYFKPDTATIVRNFQNDQHRIGLELAIHANRLRERTGLDLYVFGGIGFNWWQAYGDVLNNTDTAAFMYDYASLNNDFSNSAINGLQDGTYESALNGSNKSGYNVTWMPSVGVGIGYQVGPRFQVGIEHKTTFTRTDLWDGKDYDATGNPSGQNDIYHYSGIYLKFNIRKRRPKDTDNTTVVPTPPVTPVNPVTPTCIPPTVNVIDPFRSEYTTQASSHQIRADISNIEGAHQIAFKINGQFNTNFVYDAATGRFQSNVMLNPGQNSIEILVTNTCGTAEDRRIILRDVPQSMAPPIVSYQNPPYSPYETELSVFPLSAQVLNVDNRSQIQMTLNGANISAFSFNSTSKAVSAQLTLNEGNNVVVITGTNLAGTDSKQTVLIRKRQQLRQPPVVNFVNPVVNPTEVNQNQASILATVLHVDNKQNIVVRVNGIALNQSQFDFNSSSNMLAFTANLVEGANTVSVRGTNDVGMDEKSTTLIWKRAIVELPPIVAFLDPIENPKYVTTPSYFVRARVQNVSSASQINVWVNNVPTTNFTFNPSSQEVQLQTGLVGGANSFTVRGTNSAGMDEKSTTIIYRVSNPINPPVVNIISPLGNPAESSSPTAAVQATVLNVPSQQQISVFVNNQPLSVFAYNAQTHLVSFNAQLNEGMNTVRVVGTNQAGSAEDVQNIRYTKAIVVQPPVVTFVQPNPSPEEVQNSGYEMRATVQNVISKNQILVRLNGAMVNPNAYSFNNSTKEVVYNANLVLGANVFEVTGSNTAGSDSKSAIVNFKKPEVACDKPVVNFNQPSSNTLTVDQQQMTIGVTIQHVTSANQVVVTLNGSVVNNLAFNTSTGVLSGSINLSEGMNAIEIVATNRCGSTRASRSINYIPAQVPCVPPSISRINPVNQTIQVQEGTISILAAVVNIEEASGVEVQVNGSTVASNFDAASHLVSASVNLSEGTNIILITVENECGQSSTQWKVQYAGCKSPVINLSTSSGAGNITDNPLFNLTGNIENVDNSQNIQVTHNGSNVNFIYNPLNDAFSANINLVEGLNTIVVNATSRCGGDQKTFTTNYKPAVTINPPVVTITNPANSPHQTTVPNMAVLASVLNVSQTSQISVTVNGNQTPFAFNASLQQVQFNQNWVEGANVIVVTATNEAGTASDTKTVIYSKPVVVQPPVITFTNPVNNPYIVTTNQYTVTGYITNITSVSQVQSWINNNPFAQFNPSISNGQLNFTVPLTFDNIHTSYTVQFVATNEAGSDQDARTIRRDRDETGGNCMPTVGAVFAANHLSVNVSSTKDLSNVVLKFVDETTQKVEGLSGNTGVFAGTGAHAGKCIVGVWIKSGCNSSNDGPGYGELVPNTHYNGECAQNQPCGPRFNPGNSAWQFCLVTPSGTYTRDDLANNPNFSYQGPASSAYFLPIAGGADATVNGAPYPVQSGRYYLFTGNLNVDVRSNHPGSMGHWQICIESNAVPQSGNGNNRPVSPCESTSGSTNTEPGSSTTHTIGGGNQSCMPTVSATFSPDNQSVTAVSNKDLSNVVVKYHDNTTQKFDNLSGFTRTFTGTGEHTGKCIVGVWIKSGCNSSNDGPRYGEWVPNTNYSGQCAYNQPCGPRFNPGNSAWQFCLVTPSGTYTRDDLANNPNFSYQGPASSAYFLPIAGGADATVNGAPYPVQSGRYYLFTGNLNVDVRSNHPGSMGHWQICIESNAIPQSGNGNNRPVSPCEQVENDGGENEEDEDKQETPQINKPVRTNPVPNRTTSPRTPQPTQNENQVNPGTLRNNPNPRGGTNTGGGALQRPRP